MSTKPIPKGPVEVALGSQFRRVRRRQKVTLRDLAESLNVSVNMIRWHEAGDRMMRADLLLKSAQCMNVEPGELMNPTEEEAEANGIEESV